MKTISAGPIKRIHVNRHVLAANLKTGRNDPAWTIQTARGPITVSRWRLVTGTMAGVQAGIDADKPLSCGARVWLETRGEVEYS